MKRLAIITMTGVLMLTGCTSKDKPLSEKTIDPEMVHILADGKEINNEKKYIEAILKQGSETNEVLTRLTTLMDANELGGDVWMQDLDVVIATMDGIINSAHELVAPVRFSDGHTKYLLSIGEFSKVADYLPLAISNRDDEHVGRLMDNVAQGRLYYNEASALLNAKIEFDLD